MFLKRHFSGYQESIDNQLAAQLANATPDQVSNKPCGKTLCYSIGTSAFIRVNEEHYILFALSKTHHDTCKVYSDVELMWRALHRLWQRARTECNGYPLNLPLVGSGLSGLNLPTRDLLNLVILSAITESKAHEITQKIRIILWRDRFEDIDLREVKEHWEKKIFTTVCFAHGCSQHHDFQIINTHEKFSAVRDSSTKSTLGAGLLERLRNSKNMLLIAGASARD